MSATQRHKLATQEILHAVGATNEKAIVTAALEAVKERVAWDSELRHTLRQRYDELQALSTPKPPAPRGSKPIPIKGPDLDRYTPYGKFNPYSLLEGFGHDQLRAVLSGATPARLRQAVSVVQERVPGTKPTSQSRKADMVDYIMEHVAPGY